MKLYILLVFLSLLLGCSEENQQHNTSVNGTWLAANRNLSTYPSVTFADSTAIFTSIGDTVYRFKYSISKTNNITLTDIFNKRISSKILIATNDSLIFDGLWESKSIQRFYKKK